MERPNKRRKKIIMCRQVHNWLNFTPFLSLPLLSSANQNLVNLFPFSSFPFWESVGLIILLELFTWKEISCYHNLQFFFLKSSSAELYHIKFKCVSIYQSTTKKKIPYRWNSRYYYVVPYHEIHHAQSYLVIEELFSDSRTEQSKITNPAGLLN